MKLIIAVTSLILVGCAGVKPVAVTDADLTFQRVVEARGYSKEQIFHGTKIWITENFKSEKAVLEYENKDTGTLIGNGIISYPCSGLECMVKADWKVPFTMRVDIKDQKFRMTFSNVHLSWPPSYNRMYGSQSAYESDLDAVKPVLLKFGDQLLASFGKDKSKSDW